MQNETEHYYNMSLFHGIYLEDSFVLDLNIRLNRVEIDVDFVLTEQHRNYQPPPKTDQYCYRRGKIVFSDFSDLMLHDVSSEPHIDGAGEADFGNIDALEKRGAEFDLSGYWGRLIVRNGRIAVHLEG